MYSRKSRFAEPDSPAVEQQAQQALLAQQTVEAAPPPLVEEAKPLPNQDSINEINDYMAKNDTLRQSVKNAMAVTAVHEKELKTEQKKFAELTAKQSNSRKTCRMIDSGQVSHIADMLGLSIGSSVAGIVGGGMSVAGNFMQKGQDKFDKEQNAIQGKQLNDLKNQCADLASRWNTKPVQEQAGDAELVKRCNDKNLENIMAAARCKESVEVLIDAYTNFKDKDKCPIPPATQSQLRENLKNCDGKIDTPQRTRWSDKTYLRGIDTAKWIDATGIVADGCLARQEAEKDKLRKTPAGLCLTRIMENDLSNIQLDPATCAVDNPCDGIEYAITDELLEVVDPYQYFKSKADVKEQIKLFKQKVDEAGSQVNTDRCTAIRNCNAITGEWNVFAKKDAGTATTCSFLRTGQPPTPDSCYRLKYTELTEWRKIADDKKQECETAAVAAACVTKINKTILDEKIKATPLECVADYPEKTFIVANCTKAENYSVLQTTIDKVEDACNATLSHQQQRDGCIVKLKADPKNNATITLKNEFPADYAAYKEGTTCDITSCLDDYKTDTDLSTVADLIATINTKFNEICLALWTDDDNARGLAYAKECMDGDGWTSTPSCAYTGCLDTQGNEIQPKTKQFSKPWSAYYTIDPTNPTALPATKTWIADAKTNKTACDTRVTNETTLCNTCNNQVKDILNAFTTIWGKGAGGGTQKCNSYQTDCADMENICKARGITLATKKTDADTICDRTPNNTLSCLIAIFEKSKKYTGYPNTPAACKDSNADKQGEKETRCTTVYSVMSGNISLNKIYKDGETYGAFLRRQSFTTEAPNGNKSNFPIGDGNIPSRWVQTITSTTGIKGFGMAGIGEECQDDKVINDDATPQYRDKNSAIWTDFKKETSASADTIPSATLYASAWRQTFLSANDPSPQFTEDYKENYKQQRSVNATGKVLAGVGSAVGAIGNGITFGASVNILTKIDDAIGQINSCRDTFN